MLYPDRPRFEMSICRQKECERRLTQPFGAAPNCVCESPSSNNFLYIISVLTELLGIHALEGGGYGIIH